MDLLAQCQKWHEQGEFLKIIETLEAIESTDRNSAIICELARAYNNVANQGSYEDRATLYKVLDLLLPLEDELNKDYNWNFRLAYAYFYLDQEPLALKYFKQALELHPEDNALINPKSDLEEFIEHCEQAIALPSFSSCFAERTKNTWQEFLKQESIIRQALIEDEAHQNGATIIAMLGEIFKRTFADLALEVGYHGPKYEITFSPEGDVVRLFELVYFMNHAPKQALENWSFTIGRSGKGNFALKVNDIEIDGSDVQVWLKQEKENSYTLSCYCSKLSDLIAHDKNKATWLLFLLTDTNLGELINMRYIDNLDVLDEPLAEPGITLKGVLDKLKEDGCSIDFSAQDFLDHNYIGYKMNPTQEESFPLRADIIAGGSNCIGLLSDYFALDESSVNRLHADGAVAGFLAFDLSNMTSDEAFDLRDAFDEDKQEFATIIGGATGTHYGYIDFIAWDIDQFLQHAHQFFAKQKTQLVLFHTMRMNSSSIMLKGER